MSDTARKQRKPRTKRERWTFLNAPAEYRAPVSRYKPTYPKQDAVVTPEFERLVRRA